jgi:DNA-binding GntR family transcriptional regulator
MASTLERLADETLTLRGRVAERIRDAILNGTLTEGERIVERQLASQLGTSLSVIREAIIQLEAEGFIRKWRNSSTHVTKLSLAETEKLLDCRAVFEEFAVEQAAKLATIADKATLEQLFSDLVDAARAQNSKNYVRRDGFFHEKIWHITGNEYLHSALKRIVFPLFAFSTIRIVSHPSFDLLQDANLHLPLLIAIKANDPVGARQTFKIAFAEWRSQARAHASAESSCG